MLVGQDGEARDDGAELFAACFLREPGCGRLAPWLWGRVVGEAEGAGCLSAAAMSLEGSTDLTLRV